MTKISGSDGFHTGLPGICGDCFKAQTQDPHPHYYYCEHNQRLVVWRDGFWETFRDVAASEAAEMVRCSG